MEKELKIAGMSCQHCVHAVKMALAGVEGVVVKDVSVGSARVEVDPARVTDEQIRAALDEEGYRLETTA